MSKTADATLQSLERFDDTSLWVVRDNVPVFDAHEEIGEDGQIIRAFGREELEEIADNSNRRYIETGDAVPITLGHTRPGAPETDQPPIVGYAQQFHVGTFGPENKLGILATFYIRKEHLHTALEYPRRSVELWLRERIIDPIALLKRTPKRDLGLLTYAQQHNRLIYQMEGHYMAETMPSGIASEHDVERVGEHLPEHELAKHVEIHARALHHPVHGPALAKHYAHHMHKHAEHYASVHHNMADGPGVGAGQSTFIPGKDMAGHAPPTHHMYQKEAAAPANAETERLQQTQRDIEVSKYQRETEQLRQTNTELQKRLEALERQSRVAVYERDLGHLLSQGYQLDLAAEMAEVGDYTPEQFKKHAERIKRCYQRAPVGQTFLQLQPAANEGGRDPAKEQLSREQMQKAVSLSTREGSEFYGKYAEAVQFVKSNRN
jgi:hypothetical protein